MAGLPKKYAKMGFKKGWAAYRGSKRKKSVSRAAPKKVKHMARRRYGKRRGSGKRKFSAWRMAKGLMYTGAIALPAYQRFVFYDGKNNPSVGAAAVVRQFAFMNPETGAFDFAKGAEVWAPVAILAAVDFATTKLPIQRKISKGINNLLG